MNIIQKVGFGVAFAAAAAFAGGCAEHAPAFQCGKVDYKSCANCKSAAYSTTTVVKRHYRRVDQ